MDNRLIDVAIGLALTFALVSLLVTALMEGVASTLNHRGKNLQKLVGSVLGDDPKLLRGLFDLPIVKAMYLDARAPSYLPADVFTTGLLNLLAQGTTVQPRSGTPADFLAAVLKDSPLASRSKAEPLMQSLSTLVQGFEADWPGFEKSVQTWFEQAGERSIGWFKRGNSQWLFCIGLVMAVMLNVDAVRIASALWKDPVLRARVLAQAETALQRHSEEVAAVVARKTGTADKPPQSAGEAPKSSVTRPPSGSLSKTPPAAAVATSAVGSAPVAPPATTPTAASAPVPAPAPTPEIKLAREAVDRIATAVRTTGDEQRVALSYAMRAVVALQSSTPTEPASPAPAVAPDGLPELLKRCEAETQPTDPCRALSALAQLQETGLPIGWGADVGVPRHFTQPGGAGAADEGQTVRRTADWLTMLLGWLITAVAVTLGAPFWFDTLSRLIKLRGAGTPADETKATGGPSAAGAPALAPAPMPGPAGGLDNGARTPEEQRLSRSEIELVQQRVGMPNAQITGRFDPTTRTAIGAWQDAQGTQRTSLLSPQQIALLLTGSTRRAGTTDDDAFVG